MKLLNKNVNAFISFRVSKNYWNNITSLITNTTNRFEI